MKLQRLSEAAIQFSSKKSVRRSTVRFSDDSVQMEELDEVFERRKERRRTSLFTDGILLGGQFLEEDAMVIKDEDDSSSDEDVGGKDAAGFDEVFTQQAGVTVHPPPEIKVADPVEEVKLPKSANWISELSTNVHIASEVTREKAVDK